MQPGKQWIHFDAQFPLKFGHDLCERFGPAGELLFIQFLCGCKRTYPQGQINYRTEDELRAVLGAHFDFVNQAGDKWSLADFWRWCGARKVTRTKTLKTRTYVTATRWKAWEDDRNAKERERKANERQGKRRSRAENVAHAAHQRLEVGGWRLEGGGWRGEGGPGGEGAVGSGAKNLISQLEHVKTQQPGPASTNGQHS